MSATKTIPKYLAKRSLLYSVLLYKSKIFEKTTLNPWLNVEDCFPNCFPFTQFVLF